MKCAFYETPKHKKNPKHPTQTLLQKKFNYLKQDTTDS